MKKATKKDRILQIVMGIFVVVAGIAFIILANVGEIAEDATIIVIITGVFMVVAGPFLILVGARGLKKLNKLDEQAVALIKDESSIAFLTYGKNGEYRHYNVILDKEGQSARNAVANVAGAASFLFWESEFFNRELIQ